MPVGKPQLQNFDYALRRHEKKSTKRNKPANWLEAFYQLTVYLDSIKTNEKKVVFIDEFPWLDTHKSNFLSAFDWFWNTWGGSQEYSSYHLRVCDFLDDTKNHQSQRRVTQSCYQTHSFGTVYIR